MTPRFTEHLWHAFAALLAAIITAHVLAPSLGAALWRISQ